MFMYIKGYCQVDITEVKSIRHVHILQKFEYCKGQVHQDMSACIKGYCQVDITKIKHTKHVHMDATLNIAEVKCTKTCLYVLKPISRSIIQRSSVLKHVHIFSEYAHRRCGYVGYHEVQRREHRSYRGFTRKPPGMNLEVFLFVISCLFSLVACRRDPSKSPSSRLL